MPFEVSRFVNVTIAYHSRVIRKASCFECLVRDPNDDILLVKLALKILQIFIGRVFRLSKWDSRGIKSIMLSATVKTFPCF